MPRVHHLKSWDYFSTFSFTISTFFPPLHETLYAGNIKLFTEVLELNTHPAFQLTVVCKIASLECILHGAKKDGSWRVLNQNCRAHEGEQSTPLLLLPACAPNGVWSGTVMQEEDLTHLPGWSNPFNLFFYLLKCCTYCSELNVAPLSKNSTNKMLSLFQTTLAPTLCTKVCGLNFSCMATTYGHSIDCLLVSGSSLVIILDRNHLNLSHCAEEILHRCFSGLMCVRWSAFSAPTLNKIFCSQVLWWWLYLQVFQSLLWWTVRLWCDSHPELAHQPCLWSLSPLLCLVSQWGAGHKCHFHCSLNGRPSIKLANIHGILTIHAFQTSINLYQTGAFRSKKFSHHSLPSMYINNCHLHCHFNEHMWLTGASMMLVELDSVIIQWVKQESISSTTHKRERERERERERHYFHTDLCINLLLM